MREAGPMLRASIGWAVLLVVFSSLLAVGGSWITGIDLPVLILGLAPGGVHEMTLITLAMGMDIAFISTVHLARISIIAIALPFFQLITERTGAGTRPSAEDESR